VTPSDVADVRKTLGHRLGLGRPFTKAELGRALCYKGRDPGRNVADWEAGRRPVPIHAALVLRSMLEGFRAGAMLMSHKIGPV
jgi:hypothetical protein